MDEIALGADCELLEGVFVGVIIVSVENGIVVKALVHVVGVYLIQKLVLLTYFNIGLGITRNSQSPAPFLHHLEVVRIVILVDENSSLLARRIAEGVHGDSFVRSVDMRFHGHHSFIDVTDMVIIADMS